MAENTHITTVRANSPTISQGLMGIARALSRLTMKKQKPTLPGSPLALEFHFAYSGRDFVVTPALFLGHLVGSTRSPKAASPAQSWAAGAAKTTRSGEEREQVPSCLTCPLYIPRVTLNVN